MSRVIRGVPLLIILLNLVGIACAPTAIPTPLVTPTEKPLVEMAKTAWQIKWDKLVVDAKREGSVVAYSALASGPRQAVAETMKAKYSIDMEFVSGKGSEIIGKVEAERRAGIYAGDVILAGLTSQMLFKEKGFLETMDEVLVLPEVKNAELWMDGKFPLMDREHMMISYFSHAGSSVLISTDLVNEQEIQSYRDLLSPKWKGKILMHDPTVSGAGNLFFIINIMKIMGKDFAYQLAQQEPLIMRDPRLALEWVARGKYPILLAPDTSILGELSKAGAPLKHIVPREGTYSGGGSGGLALLNRAAHPNAAAVLINWLLTKDGQTVMAKAQPDQSRRLDVPADFIDVDRRLDPKIRYIDSDEEEFIVARLEMAKVAKEIFGIK